MSELTDQEKLERRRQKRQQKILQAGESRLSKITGTAYPLRTTPSPTPSPSTSVNKPTPSTSFRTTRRDSDDPSEELGAPQADVNNLMNQTFAQMFGGISGISGSESALNPAALLGAMGGGQDVNQEALAQMLAGEGASGFNSAMFANMTGNGTSAVEVVDDSKYWNVLHFVMMVLLGFYAVYVEYTKAGLDRFASLLSDPATNYPSIHVPVFWYFITLELGLQSARMFYQKGNMPVTSTWATIAMQLPHPIGNIVTVFMRYRLIWTCLSQDICVLVFIIGLSQLVSHLFV